MNTTETITIPIPVPTNKTIAWVNNVLTLVDKKEVLPITERIKTFEDACRELGEDHPLWKSYRSYDFSTDADIEALFKLRIICAALNERWKPYSVKDELCYYPCFWLYTEDEFNDMDIDKRKTTGIMQIDNHYKTGYAGFAFSDSISLSSNDVFLSYSLLSLKSPELAEYCGKQFLPLWADLYLPRENFT